jgi:exosortase B
MTSTKPTEPAAAAVSRHTNLLPWGLLLLALLLMYAPVVYELARTLWTTDQNSHGPIVLVMALWFFQYKLRQVSRADIQHTFGSRLLGAVLLFIGGCLYVVGVSQEFYLFGAGSMLPVFAGAVLLLGGQRVLAKLWFAFFFLFFMVPLPGAVVDTLTQPLKVGVSWGAEHLLYALGYPVSRNGVIIFIGQYQLLVADACAGLNSLFTLEALGLMYMNVVRHESVLRNAVLAILIAPISFVSNLTRVLVLSLVTYYYGDAAGQGFIHSFSGMVLFLTALMLILVVDGVLRKVSARLWPPHAEEAVA